VLAPLAAMAWGLWIGRRAVDLPRLALVGAWMCYAYFMLSVQVHESHFYMIVPLLSLAAVSLPAWRQLFWLLSAMFSLNLNLSLFYGFGDRAGFATPRTLTVIDATAWLSIANVAVFIWFGRRLRRCLDGPSPAFT